MKGLIPILLVLFNLNIAYSQIPTTRFFSGDAAIPTRTSFDAPVVRMPKVDSEKLKREDLEEAKMGVPPRFGKDIDVDYTLENSGRWEKVKGGKVWKLEVYSEKSHSINMIFNDFFLAEGAELIIYNKEMNMMAGPITSSSNNKLRKFSTDIIIGQSVILEFFEPERVEISSTLRIVKVIHAYKNLFNTDFPGVTSGFGASAPCHNDINCQVGQNWQVVSNSVAMVLLANNTRHCSGALLNNTCQDFTPNFLTAFHCVDVGAGADFRNENLSPNEIDAAEDWVFRFQYKSPICNGSDAVSFHSFSGSQYRAALRDTDFALFELNSRPTASTGITYSGWATTAIPATSSVGIHHPNGDVMKISIDEDPATSVGWFQPNTHWRVNFDDGVVQHGSSGSPLFNQNLMVIGQLHGNQNYSTLIPYCDQPIGEYGRFDVSWVGGGTNATRLSNWLDPMGIGVGTTNTIPIPSVTGPDRICTTNTNFTLQNVPAGQTATWAVSPIHLFPTTGRSGTGTTAALRAMHSSSSGLATLTYTIGTGCGEYQVQKQIWVGVPGALTSILPNYQPICTGEYTYFNAYYNMYNPNQPGNGEADIINYVWTPPSGASCFTAGNKNEVLACWFQTGAGFGMNQTVAVRAVNSCGQGAMSYGNFSVSDCFYYSVGINPNPASNRVTIELIETPLDAEAKAVLGAENKGARDYQEYSFNSPPHRIRVFDIVGAERLCVENVPEGNRHELDISHLTPGVYVVHIEHRNGTVVRQLRVD